MTKPVRLRLSRARGFDLQAHSHATNGLPAVNVARPSHWGNPFIVGKHGDRAYCVQLFRYMMGGTFALSSAPEVEEQQVIRTHIFATLAALRGKNLACWCALDGKPCHADVLLELARGPICVEAMP